MFNEDKKNLQNMVIKTIEDFINCSPENRLDDYTMEKAFDPPLVGFSRGDDPLFVDLKKHVGPFHWTPQEIFSMSFPDEDVSADQLSIISWVLPQTKATKKDNRKEKSYPSERWVRARIFGEAVNEKLRAHMVSFFHDRGFKSVAPVISPQWERKESDLHGYASTWSERHIAYVAGLGTFGLSDGLITPYGKAMRLGSVVVKAQLTPTPRKYSDHHAYCLFYSKNTCGKCISRCPSGAITVKGHDKKKCKAYIRDEKLLRYIEKEFGFKGRGCGLCQTGVPCESKIPKLSDV